jgi:hypothetical protein
MIDNLARTLGSSRKAEYDERSIEWYTLVFFSRCTPGISPEDDLARSSIYLDIHVSVMFAEKESITDRLLRDDPLLTELIDILFDTSTLHIVRIWEKSYRKKPSDDRHDDHELEEGKSFFPDVSKSEIHRKLLTGDRDYLHDSTKYRDSKPKYKNTSKQECDRFDIFYHVGEREVDFSLILSRDLGSDGADRRSTLGTLDHLEDIWRKKCMFLIMIDHRSRDLVPMSDIIRDRCVELTDDEIARALSRQTHRLHDTHTRT